jgi:hypothetical protein
LLRRGHNGQRRMSEALYPAPARSLVRRPRLIHSMFFLSRTMPTAPLPFLPVHPVCLRSFALRHYFRRLAVGFNNPVLAKHKTDDPSTAKTGPATISPSGYCIAERASPIPLRSVFGDAAVLNPAFSEQLSAHGICGSAGIPRTGADPVEAGERPLAVLPPFPPALAVSPHSFPGAFQHRAPRDYGCSAKLCLSASGLPQR